MARNPGHFRIKHFNHPLLLSQGDWLAGFLFHFQAQQTHFIKLNEPSTGSFCISIYKLSPQQRGEGKEPEPVPALLQLPPLLSGLPIGEAAAGTSRRPQQRAGSCFPPDPHFPVKRCFRDTTPRDSQRVQGTCQRHAGHKERGTATAARVQAAASAGARVETNAADGARWHPVSSPGRDTEDRRTCRARGRVGTESGSSGAFR